MYQHRKMNMVYPLGKGAAGSHSYVFQSVLLSLCQKRAAGYDFPDESIVLLYNSTHMLCLIMIFPVCEALLEVILSRRRAHKSLSSYQIDPAETIPSGNVCA